MHDKTEFAVHIADRLRDAERGVDQAIADTALMMHDLTRHRADAGFAAQTGHDAFLETAAGVAALVEARSRFVSAHGMLYRDAVRAGVAPHTLVGPETKPGDRPRRTLSRLADTA